jgi:hypothetical protein
MERKVAPKIFHLDFEINTFEDYSTHLKKVLGFYEFCRSSDIPIVLVSSETVFRSKRWGKYKENSKPNPNTNSGLLYLGLEAIANLFDHVKIVRGTDEAGIGRFAARFSEMPKILHIAPKPTILNTSKAKKLGIL